MKTFKQFKSSLDKIKKKVKWKESPIHFKSAFSEQPISVRKNTSSEKVNEEFTPFERKHIKYTHGAWEDEDHNTKIKKSIYGTNYVYDCDFHDHEDVKPQKLEPHHTQAIHNYCSVGSDKENGHGSSANINGMLRNMDGDKSSRVMHQNPEDVKDSIHTLSSAFTKDNTNRKEITTWGGIPVHIGKKLMKDGVGSHHHLSGFTSTSSDKETALKFSRTYNNNEKKAATKNGPLHIVQYHIKPGVGLSAVHYSKFSENEVMLHHGAHIEYHGHQVIQHKRYPHSELYQEKLYLHHVTVHPEHKSLDEYGQYDHPKD